MDKEITKLSFYFCTTILGVIEKTERGYIYTSNVNNEQKLLDCSSAFNYAKYDLFNSNERESPTLFPEFERILRDCSRKDILERTGINPTDSSWEKLAKLSAWRIATPSFFVARIPPIA